MADMATDEIEPHVAMRVGRREVLHRESPINFDTVISENVLRGRSAGAATVLNSSATSNRWQKSRASPSMQSLRFPNAATRKTLAPGKRWHFHPAIKSGRYDR